MMLYGRQRERAVLAALLDRARRSHSGLLVLRGPPGIGKSALLEDVVSRAKGMRVLRAVGVESESQLAFATLHQLIRPVVGRIDEIPEPQAGAVRSAIGLASPGGEDPFLVGAGVLSLLALAADEQPLLCIVDDAQWVDAPSAAALTFAARRLHAERIGVLIATRDDQPCPSVARGAPELVLHGIEASAAAALVAERVDVAIAEKVRDELIETSGGNPLVLLELPQALTADQRAGRAPLDEPLPLTVRLEEAFRVHAESLPVGSRLFLLLAAADNTHDPAVVVDAARSLEIAEADIAAVDAAGLVRLGESRVEFRHPLVRSAVYRSASLGLRQHVHRALAEVLVEERYADCRAWNLAAAALGPDESIAQELERTAERARARGGPATAVAALARAAALTADDERRGLRQLAAAEAAVHAGQNETATALLEEARRTVSDPSRLADVEHLRGLIELRGGSPVKAHSILLPAALAVEPHDPQKAAQILLDATTASVYGGDLTAQVTVGRHAARLIDRVGPTFEATAAAGFGALWDVDPERGRVLLEETIARADTSSHPHRFLWASVASLQLGDETRARMLAARAVASCRRDGAITDLAVALSRLAFAEVVEGRLPSARANAAEGFALATQADLENLACYHRALLAWIAALGGSSEDAQALAHEASEVGRAHDRAWQCAIGMIALGERALGEEQPLEALRHFSGLAAAASVAAHPYLQVIATPSFVEAAARAGRANVVAAALDRFERWVTMTRSRSQLPLLVRSKALLAGGAEAREGFEDALRLHQDVERPLEWARTELLYGESLRRDGARHEARDHLRVAHELFEQAGAAAWARQAQSALRASGESLSSRRVDPTGLLTPQELQIARFVAGGATNKQVAGKLFLSTRTVDAHLRSIFTKLGITSRSQLGPYHLGDSPSEHGATASAVSPMRT